MKPKPHTFSALLAAIVLAGGVSAAQAQTSAQQAPSQQPAPSTEQAPPSATQPAPGMPGTAPSGNTGQGTIEVDPDEARAIMQAREMCSKAADPQAQQDCMNQAQQDYYRARSGAPGTGGSGSMQPGQDSTMNPHSPAAPSDPSGSSNPLPRQ